eukprot:3014020-Amphidinium_carterae.1
MQLQVAYTVLVLSMSITLRSNEITEASHLRTATTLIVIVHLFGHILASDGIATPQNASQIWEVIFNSLAIIFITDLDEKSFEAASALFHFDMEAYGDLQENGIPFEKDCNQQAAVCI